MPNDGPKNATSNLKDIAFLLPVMGSAVAVSYDVGYFWALDIKMFTMFSLTEHIVFALEALPIAIIGSLVLVGYAALARLGYERGQLSGELILEKIKRGELTAGDALKSVEKGRFIRIFLPAIAFTLGIVEIWLKVYSVGVFFIIALAWLKADDFFPSITRHPTFIQITTCLSLMIVAFAAGVQLQDRDESRQAASHILKIGDKELSGLVIRSGEKGILFVQIKPKQLMFIKWDQISSVQSMPVSG